MAPDAPRTRRAMVMVGALATAVVVAGCGSSSSAGTAKPAVQPLGLTGGHASIGALSVTGAYIPDPATPTIAAAYFTVTNSGSADRLLSVNTSGFHSAMLNHYVTTSNGAETMTALPGGAVIPAHGKLVLRPGSFHVMLERPLQPVKQGTDARLTLRFQRAGTISLVVPVVADTGLPGDADSTSMPGMDMSGSG